MEGTTTPTATGSTTTGPTTFSEMPSTAWSDAPSASAPSPDHTSAETSTATTTPPADTVPVEGQPQQGEPPKERWNDILANARTKAAQDANAQWQQYEWAKQVKQQDLQQAISISQKLRTDAGPEAFVTGLQEILAEGQRNPAIAAALRSFQGRALAQLRQQAQTQPQAVDFNPRAIQLEDGSIFSGYSADQVQAFVAQEVGKVKQELQPVMETHKQLQEREAAQQHDQEVNHFVSTTFADVQKWPGMEPPAGWRPGMDVPENWKALANELVAANVDPSDPRDVILAAHAAYHKVVLPKLSSSAEAKLLDSLKTRAAASTSVNPGSAAPSASRQVTRFQDLGPDSWR